MPQSDEGDFRVGELVRGTHDLSYMPCFLAAPYNPDDEDEDHVNSCVDISPREVYMVLGFDPSNHLWIVLTPLGVYSTGPEFIERVP